MRCKSSKSFAIFKVDFCQFTSHLLVLDKVKITKGMVCTGLVGKGLRKRDGQIQVTWVATVRTKIK